MNELERYKRYNLSYNLGKFFKIYYKYGEVVPWYKGYWYNRKETNSYACVIIPINIPLSFLTNAVYIMKIINLSSMYFYEDQIELRKKKRLKQER